MFFSLSFEGKCKIWKKSLVIFISMSKKFGQKKVMHYKLERHEPSLNNFEHETLGQNLTSQSNKESKFSSQNWGSDALSLVVSFLCLTSHKKLGLLGDIALFMMTFLPSMHWSDGEKRFAGKGKFTCGFYNSCLNFMAAVEGWWIKCQIELN